MKYILFITAFTLLISCKKTTKQPTTTSQISTIEFHPPSWIIGNWSSAASAQIGNYTAFGFTFLKDDVQQVNGITNSLKTLLNNTNANNGSIVAKIDNEISNSTDYSFKEILSSVTANYYFKKIDANTMMFYTSDPSLPNVGGVKMIKYNLQSNSNSINIIQGNGVTDIEGNKYKTIIIGNQEWMQENLNVGKYENGDKIPNYTDSMISINEFQGAYSIYKLSPKYEQIYGKLYNYYSIDYVCPTGWHVPKDIDWDNLISYLGGENIAGRYLKSLDTSFWHTQNSNLYNLSNFSALPGGFRSSDSKFYGIGKSGFWWSSGNRFNRILSDTTEKVNKKQRDEHNFYSIRCIKN